MVRRRFLRPYRGPNLPRVVRRPCLLERDKIVDQYRMVKGTVDQIEGLLNEAGFTVVFREFSPESEPLTKEEFKALHESVVTGIMVEPKPLYYRFLMTRAANPFAYNPAELAKSFRAAVTAIGFGDRLPPEPPDATVTPLKQVPPPES